MTPSDLRGEIERLLDLLVAAEIAVYANPVVLEKMPGGRRRVTWHGIDTDIGDAFREEFGTVDSYCHWLELSAYSAVLFDGSLLQLTYDFHGGGLVGHRLAYHPCPYDVDERLLKSEPLLDVLSLYRGGLDSSVRLRSPLRFEFDSDAAQEQHPAVHLTLLWNHCRWAVACPLSPGHFVRFLFRHFYPRLWLVHDFIRSWPQHQNPRIIRRDEEAHLHIACLHAL